MSYMQYVGYEDQIKGGYGVTYSTRIAVVFFKDLCPLGLRETSTEDHIKLLHACDASEPRAEHLAPRSAL